MISLYLNIDGEAEVTGDYSTQGDVSPVNEGGPMETEEVPEEAPEEEAPEQVPEEAPQEVDQDHSGDEGEQKLSGEDSSDSEVQYESDGSLLMDSSESQDDSPPQEETEEPSVSQADEGAVKEQDHEELLEQLLEQRDKALSHSSQLQAKLPQYIKRNSKNFGGLDSGVSSAEQLQLYKQNIKMLRDLKEQLVTEAQEAQQQIEELSLRCQEKKNEVSQNQEKRKGADVFSGVT